MLTQKLSSVGMFLMVLVLVAAACTPTPSLGTPAAFTSEPLPATPMITAAPPQPSVNAPPPVETPAVTACPNPGEGQSLYSSEENGFCFVFPAYFTPTLTTEGRYEVVTLFGPRETLDPNQMEGAAVILSVMNSGPAEGLDSAGYAAKYQQVFGPMPDNLQQTPATIGGQPAVIVSNLPGFFSQQIAFVVANGYRYRISLSPEPGMIPELDEHLRLAWDMVTGSIAFQTPTSDRPYISANQVCPAETGETRLYVSERDGYCLLYPADFTLDPQFPGNFKGGPVLGDYGDFPDVTTSLTVGTFGMFTLESPREIFSGIIQRSDPASVQDATIGGYPAVVMRTVDEPWDTRTAGVLANGQSYTILAQPWEPERWPDGIPYLEMVWETAINSIAFFDPWR